MTCVHCGFCPQACPRSTLRSATRTTLRGRILLMRSLVEGRSASMTPTSIRTLDQCLGCRGCETACPSGVPYGHLLEGDACHADAGASAAARRAASASRFERPRLLALVLAGARLLRATRLPRLLGRLPGRIGFSMGMLAATEARVSRRAYTRRGTGTRGRTAILEGCVMRGLYADTNRATARTLRANDYDVVEVDGQQCCGALHAHAGDLEGARRCTRECRRVRAVGARVHRRERGGMRRDDEGLRTLLATTPCGRRERRR